MGFLPEREVSEMPIGMQYLYDTYKDVRFSVTNSNKLAPREPLNYETLNAYQQAMRFDLSPTECSVIMSTDAIFNTSTQ